MTEQIDVRTRYAQDPAHRDLALGATGVLREFNEAGVLIAADVHVARRLSALAGCADPVAHLALALAVRAVRTGSVCVDLAGVEEAAGEEGADLDWPSYDALVAAVDASPLAGTPPVLRRSGSLLYLDRYWLEEEQIRADLVGRTERPAPDVDVETLDGGLARIFHRPRSEDQRAAARLAVEQWTTVLTGGPGTGKTTTVAGILALLAEQAEVAGRPRPRIALAAPTGKAAARLQEAIGAEVAEHFGPEDRRRLAGLEARTLHRLLGFRPDNAGRFRHHRDNRLPHDVVVVDETSMVSLTMMARLLEAVRPGARLLLVGDPDQLASIEAGAVLADLVSGLGGPGDREETGEPTTPAGSARPLEASRAAGVAELRLSHRFGSVIGALAEAVRAGDADRTVELLAAGDPRVVWITDDDPLALREVLLPPALSLHHAAAEGDHATALAALDRHRLLCAHREGPYGVRHWNRVVERWLAEETGVAAWEQWYAGRPVMVTANDHGLGVYNGDTGVVVPGTRARRPRVWLTGLDRGLPASRLGDLETMHAMTIHKSQGSQAGEVTVLLPEPESRLLTRELFYTAVTRAQEQVRVVGSPASVRAAVTRRAQRASGLAGRLGAR